MSRPRQHSSEVVASQESNHCSQLRRAQEGRFRRRAKPLSGPSWLDAWSRVRGLMLVASSDVSAPQFVLGGPNYRRSLPMTQLNI